MSRNQYHRTPSVSAMEEIPDEDLDDILDKALEEFEEEEQLKISAEASSAAGIKVDPSKTADALLREGQKVAVTQELVKHRRAAR